MIKQQVELNPQNIEKAINFFENLLGEKKDNPFFAKGQDELSQREASLRKQLSEIERQKKGVNIKKGLTEIPEDFSSNLGLLVKAVAGLADFKKGLMTQFESLKTEVNNLKKGNERLVTENKNLKVRLQKVENTPLGQKSITKDYIQKGIEASSKDAKTLSLSDGPDRMKVKSILESKADFNKGENDPFCKGLLSFEATGALTPEVIQRLNLEGYNIVE